MHFSTSFVIYIMMREIDFFLHIKDTTGDFGYIIVVDLFHSLLAATHNATKD